MSGPVAECAQVLAAGLFVTILLLTIACALLVPVHCIAMLLANRSER
jgi:hypothetical protein